MNTGARLASQSTALILQHTISSYSSSSSTLWLGNIILVCIFTSTMVVPESQGKMYHPPLELQRDAHVPDFSSYLVMYKRSLENPEAFWKEVAHEFFWKKPATGPMLQYNFDVTKGNIFVKCMEGAKTNICYNVLDRHVREGNLGEKVAYYW
ncbi:hypothetical protein CHARACLAT_018756 [Characodon lateralis]|uniref:Acetyl-coenzyme A synthetase N-terminal domain-containing protein n=1 Tax=Characodon lateralis TaxID=208331 RepID=A0ABU7DHV6_9TELE|nr:hypothetical protein [Characodon lateralis]